MKNEYLITTVEQNVYFISKEFDDKRILKTINKVPDRDKYILIIELASNNESSARILSKIHEDIINTQDLILLRNESSEYFLNKLYPYVIDLELKLRKLLRLVSSLDDTHSIVDMSSNISKIEEKTLSDLFEYLFTDVNFNKGVRSLFQNEKELSKHQFTKNRYKEIVEKLEENTPWNQLLGNSVSSLVNKYIQVLETRNAIAHAHSINLATYSKYVFLLKKVISELDDTIRSYETTHERSEIDSNAILSETLTSYLEFSKSIDIANLTHGLVALGTAVENYNSTMAPFGNSLININNNISKFTEPLRMLYLKADYENLPLKQILNDFGRKISELANSESKIEIASKGDEDIDSNE